MEERTCECGCGEIVTPGKKYKKGHYSRVHNNWGHNPKAIKNSAKTRKERHIEPWNKGKKGLQTAWNKGLTKETNESVASISNKMKVIKKADIKNSERLAKISREYWSKQENRDKQRKRHVKYLRNTFISEPTKPERKFMKLLEKNKLSYVFQYNIDGYLYDFWIHNIDLLVEVDGDFHHCNPDVHPIPIYEIQKHTLEHDKVKNKIAKDKGYKLLRIWENDINNNLDNIEKRLKI